MAYNTRNPYIIGPPIENKDQLFGRAILLRTIADSLQQNAKFILLHGQRRIGKSSVLKNIPLFISQDEFLFVHCDLQEHGSSSLGEILYAIASAICEHLNVDRSILNSLQPRDLDNNPRIFARRLLPTVLDSLGNKNLVLLLDEFDVVTQTNTETAFAFLRFLENLVRQYEELFLIAVVGRYLDSMPNLVQSFRGGIYQEIGLLDYESTKQQITQPAENILLYQQKTIEEILKFSAGHPYYTQALCHAIFNQARDESCWTVIPACVSDVVNQAIEQTEAGLASIWVGLSISEKVVILAVAEAQKQNTLENPFKLLEAYGLVLTDPLKEAIQLLISKGFLDSNPIKVKVELFRLWLLQRHQLRDEVRTLETLEEENVEQLLPVARNCWGADRHENALNIYEQVLKLNPNHFSTVVELAEKYLYLANFDKALQLYERAYKLDPVSHQQKIIQVLNQYGHLLLTQENYERAKQQYKRILTIDPVNSLAKQDLASIKTLQDKKNNISTNKQKQIVRFPIPLLILVLIGIAGSLFAGVKLFNSCPPIFCRNIILPSPSNSNTIISRGDRTLFRDIQNSDRDKGIDSFKNGNYTQAENYFKKAFSDNNHPDPEVLIYQNNALARQNGNPLTLAVVVPATNATNSAQEMLRGIAQAQNQFNKKNGLNGRLLEIVIADDKNDEDTAKLVADELVHDKSLLGVIGHGSSNVTDVALPIYTKANLAVISSTSSSTEFQSSVVFFRTVNSNKVTGENLAEYAWKLNLKKIAIFCNLGDPYSGTMREEFRVKYEKLGGEIVGGGQCINLSQDLNVDKEVQKIILAPNPAQAIALFPDTRHLELAGEIAKVHKELIDSLQQNRPNIQRLKLLGGDVLYNDTFLKKYSDALEDLVLSVPWFREAEKSKDFAQTAEKQWGGDISWRTATSFDATKAFIESFRLSLNSSNLSQETVLANLPQVHVSSNDTSGEELMFDEKREVKREEILIMVHNGKFIVIPKQN
ncbi:ABC transporter substrate-binding protein [Nostoc sp. JL33]|uniref:ABC transporter substrate-binding protein n=1 Tax=Nostoc sp. JL33 TaxID=2815396 RepID=UPI0025DA0764|nr:ABC transporter substrate-binding protein [Nostoc sp. JL33]MBN3870512.1 ABC transporter substrate-binding protein [Nostoc sp. JL33]